ncbi:uncharacterized protein G2W53_026816 [Senna tora]|uniref:Uncharacterized protein n=1 Tax=Senna tora TaxID=362788 RepID=A0A834WJ42_9FABA|nr:uncharacterized protein G2W53_026816 [Senna tora]
MAIIQQVKQTMGLTPNSGNHANPDQLSKAIPKPRNPSTRFHNFFFYGFAKTEDRAWVWGWGWG